MLMNKEGRVNAKQQAMKKYKSYLEEIRDKHPEEFDEVRKTNERHFILVSENSKQDHKIDELQSQLQEVKDATTKYIKDKQTELMKLYHLQ